ncbi:sterol desaturase family protein [Peribacillus tepidiphilus]|uniref:sterol desaturase family protein n=1 Tax=Peribacillus tepidiphilus TaxID=2652445 RepID=UPI001290D31A|nr:sterol desaturase family protein [Peribacillus tepidiphilus]
MSKSLYRDFFLHIDMIVMFTLFIGIASFVIGKGLTWSLFLYFAIGLVTFMFSEYITHRFLFHIKAPKNAFLLKVLKRLHYDHHKDPNDLKLLFLPIWFSIPNLAVLSLIFFFITSTLIGTLAFSLGLIFMLLVYEWKHYVAHRPFKVKSKFGQWLKKTHILHHYKNENYWYGVSTPFIDVLFGTLKDAKEVETSQTVKDLEGRSPVHK